MAAPGSFPGIGPIVGFNDPVPEATPEEVHGSPVNPSHAEWGEKAQPYSWESQMTNYKGHTGPYGIENEMLGVESELFGMDEGQLHQDPQADMVPYRGHAAPMTVTLSGALPSQYDAINKQVVQAAEIRSTDLGSSRKYTINDMGQDVQNDHWQEIWDVSDEPEKYPPGPSHHEGTYTSFGFGTNDRPTNPMRKRNGFGYGLGHHHRRFAIGSIPGNYMWMKPGGRPMVKTLAGPAKPAVGPNSPFEGDDLSQTFGIQGSVLVEVPSEYQPPPSPTLAAPVNYDEPAPPVPLW